MFLRISTLILYATLLASPVSAQFWPAAPTYPYENLDTVKAEAQKVSNRLERFIKQWAAGSKQPTMLPDSVMQGIDPLQYGKLYLVNPETYTAEPQWSIRPARPIRFDSLEAGYPDPHFTYLLAPVFAPFGSKLCVEGDFPRCRFFNFQISPSFDPRFYVYNRCYGSPEINLVDYDIEPDAGHVNPFRVGANRNAVNRHYHVVFDMAMGPAVELNPGYTPPRFTSTGNRRSGSGIQYQGPWGLKDTTKAGNPPLFAYPAAGGGKWDISFLWVRYYAMDNGVNTLGGVTYPKMYYQLPTGEKFWIQPNIAIYNAIVNQTRPATQSAPTEPVGIEGPTMGWKKQFGVSLNGFEEFYRAWGWTRPEDKAHIRKLELGITGRGEDQPPIGNYEGSATLCTYNTFMGRPMSLGAGKIIVLTGKMPTYPNTRPGTATMTAAQMRYWSITSYDADIFTAPAGVAINCVMDDEVVLNNERKYVIVYSRPEDKPANATTTAGVTWVDWGPTAKQAFIWRWNAVPEAWTMPDTTPNEINLPKSKSAWSGTQYDSSLIGVNGHNGRLGWYQPQIHYLTKAEFEALGTSVKAENVPTWGPSNIAISSKKMNAHMSDRNQIVQYHVASRTLVVYGLPSGGHVVEIYNLQGRGVVKVQSSMFNGSNKMELRINTINPGYYVARVTSPLKGNKMVTVYPFLITGQVTEQ